MALLVGAAPLVWAQPDAPPAPKVRVKAKAAPREPDTDPERADALLRTALAQRRVGAYGPAVQALQRAFALSPRPSYVYLMGEIQQEAGRKEEALESYQRYLSLAPTAPDRPYVQQQIAILQAERPREPQAPRPAPMLETTPVVPSVDLLAPAPASKAPAQASAPAPAGKGSRGSAVWIFTAAGVVAAAGLGLGLGFGLRPTEPTFAVAPGALR